MHADQFTPAWYVLHTKSRFENVVNDGLTKKSLDVFLPKIKVPSRRRDRKLMIQVPLFPGYVFVRSTLEPHQQLEIVKTVGVVRFIGNRGVPLPVPESDIDSLKIMVANDDPIKTGNRFKKGTRVIVVSGPFTGVTGIFVRYQKSSRIVVQIDALGQFASVEVDADSVETVAPIVR